MFTWITTDTTTLHYQVAQKKVNMYLIKLVVKLQYLLYKYNKSQSHGQGEIDSLSYIVPVVAKNINEPFHSGGYKLLWYSCIGLRDF